MSAPGVCLRAARPTDAGAIGAILSEHADTTDWLPRLHSRAEDIAHAGLMIDRGWVTVAEGDAGIAGFVACDGLRIQSLYVRAGRRGLGIGNAMLEHARQHRARLELWAFEANPGAQRFYERAGFVLVEQTDGQGDGGQGNDARLPDRRYVWHRQGEGA